MATPLDNRVPLTGNVLIDGLTWGAAWDFGGAAHVLSYSLSLNDSATGGAWTPALADAARRALQEWANVANLTFVEYGSGTVYLESPADIALILTGNDLGSDSLGIVGLGVPPSPSFVDVLFSELGTTRLDYRQPEGDVALDNYDPGFSHLDPGGAGLWIMLHEIGHALGLKHTYDSWDGRPTFASLGITNFDSNLYTVMSYADPNGQPLGTNLVSGNAATPMALDILAIQRIYGANTQYHTGDDIYYLRPTNAVRAIWDAGGVDTLGVSAGNEGSSATLDLREGAISSSGNTRLAIAYQTLIENALGGAGHDSLTGNAIANRLDGAGGNDSMSGGQGDDIYLVDSAGDAVIELAGEGTDRIDSSITLALPEQVENLALTGSGVINGSGNGAANELWGNAANNLLEGLVGKDVLHGGAGNDTLDGGAGGDTMMGGAGDDVYIVSDIASGTPNALDLAGEPGSWYLNGSSASASISPSISFLMLDQTGDGLIDYIDIADLSPSPFFLLTLGTNQLGQNLAVGSYVNVERASFATAGHAGLDLGFDGRGASEVFGNFTIHAIDIDYGHGSPVLQRLVVSFEIHAESATAPPAFGSFNYMDFGDGTTLESVIEQANEGMDEVRSAVSYALPSHLENLTLTGNGATNAIGNELSNGLTGNAANNVIDAQAGKDTLTGGAGDDSLDGGSGLDQALFSARQVAYALTKTDGAYTIADASGSDGTDTLSHIERLGFADACLAFDVDGSAGQVYRLYKAAFARTPDLVGLGGWIKGMDQGLSLEQVASAFSASAEFQSLYGSSTSNEQFVMLLYLNALGRAPEAGGVSGWAGQLAAGAISRAQLLVQFSESPENTQAVGNSIADGILFATAEQAAGPARGQSFTGTDGADSLLGSVGNDSFTGGLGNDSIHGGAGLDQAFYSGNRASYSLSSNATSLTVAGGSDGSDTLSQVERIRFADQALAFDTEGNAGQTYRLYQAAFERTPDTQGLSDWMRGMDGGMTLRQVASGFISSAEFQGLYGASPSDQAFVTLLYQNVLNRAPDAGGQAYWLDELGRGLTREMALIGFSESSENKAALIGVMENGIEYLLG